MQWIDWLIASSEDDDDDDVVQFLGDVFLSNRNKKKMQLKSWINITIQSNRLRGIPKGSWRIVEKSKRLQSARWMWRYRWISWNQWLIPWTNGSHWFSEGSWSIPRDTWKNPTDPKQVTCIGERSYENSQNITESFKNPFKNPVKPRKSCKKTEKPPKNPEIWDPGL